MITIKNIFLSSLICAVLLIPHFSPLYAEDNTSLKLNNSERQELLIRLLQKIVQLQNEIIRLNNIEDNKVAVSVSNSNITKADYTKGAEKAQIQILTYTDYECPFCKRFHSTLNSILKNNENVSVTYRHLPLEELHPNAKEIAIAAECVGQIGGDTAFWKFTDSVFDSPTVSQSIDMSLLPNFATKANVSISKFNTCIVGRAASEAVEADVAEALDLEIRGTPHSIVYKNNKQVDIFNGALPEDQVQATIDELLK